MSGEKIGSLTNNSHGGWGCRMQTGKYLSRHPHLLLSWDAWGCGKSGLRPWEVGRWPEQAEWEDSLEGREEGWVVPPPPHPSVAFSSLRTLAQVV